MSSVVRTRGFNNILACGYLREYEHYNNLLIAQDIQGIIIKYSKQYAIYDIGSDEQINCRSIRYICKSYGININNSINNNKPIINISSIKLVSSGIANDSNLFIYTANNLLFNGTIRAEKTCIYTRLGLNQIDTTFLQHDYDTITDIQCGVNHTLMLTRLGNVYSMGVNDVGQCGFNANKISNISTPKLMMKCIISIACGAFHNLLINNKYQLIVCGYNYCGQIGVTQNDINVDVDLHTGCDNSDDDYDYDYDLYYYDDDDDWRFFEEIDLDPFQMADTSDDEDDCYFDTQDKNGNKTLLLVDIPIINKYFQDLNIKIVKVYAGKFHSLCIDQNGKTYTFGQNALGNLGNGEISEWGCSNPIPQQVLIELNDLNHDHDHDMHVIDGSCGENHNLLLTKNNEIVAFGDNSMSQCSIINKKKVINSPFIIEKYKEFGLASSTVIEKVICLKNKSLIFIDPYAR